jgi:hypothetical protein
MLVKEIMTENPDHRHRLDTEIFKAAKILLDNRINGLPVVDDNGKLVGILCQSDIIAQQKKLPIPSLFSFLDGYISLSSMKGIGKGSPQNRRHCRLGRHDPQPGHRRSGFEHRNRGSPHGRP